MALGENAPAELVAEYARVARALYPRGLAWAEGLGSNLRKLLEGQGDSWGRVDVRAGDLLAESDPRTTSELLTDWERVLGLPAPCSTLPELLQLRRAAIVAKFTGNFGQSKQDFLDLAASLGWDSASITITEERAFRAGISRAGDRAYSEEWAYVWRVTAPEEKPSFFLAGESSAGDRLVETDNELLRCFLEELKPAHTVVLVDFVDPWVGYSPWTDLTPSGAVLELVAPGTSLSFG